jgi:hypothetical protein
MRHRWGKGPQAITVDIDPSVDMQSPPVEQVRFAAESVLQSAYAMHARPPIVIRIDQNIVAQEGVRHRRPQCCVDQ